MPKHPPTRRAREPEPDPNDEALARIARDLLPPEPLLPPEVRPLSVEERHQVLYGASAILAKRMEAALPAGGNGPARHSRDYASVYWHGLTYTFTPLQAACVKVLWEAWNNGTPVMRQETILEEAESCQTRLSEVFESGNHPAWETMIVKVEKPKGCYRLADAELED